MHMKHPAAQWMLLTLTEASSFDWMSDGLFWVLCMDLANVLISPIFAAADNLILFPMQPCVCILRHGKLSV